MNKCSFGNGCYERSVWSCNCVNPYAYVCDRHIKKHLRAPGKHETECSIVELTSRQTTEFLPRLKDLLKYFKGYRKRIIDNSKDLIECIEKEAKKTLINIKNLKKIAVDLICERGISKENYERIKSITIGNQIPIRYEVENIKENVKTLFEFDDSEGRNWKECNEIIFSRDANGGLQSIDLTTFKLSSLEYAPNLGRYCHACKIDQKTYFFHGGVLNKQIKTEAYLINIKDNKYEKLAEGPGKCGGGGSALKNNKVYIFGGNIGTNNSTDACDIFDLKTKKWESITPLPKASYGITAAILNNDIILSGHHLSNCYSYNDSTFTVIFKFHTGHKVVCEGWIYANSILYENQDQNNSAWISHNVNYSLAHYLWTYCVFKKNQYLYFIDTSNSLMRIDTKMKIIEAVGFI